MSTTDNGGPAFPTKSYNIERDVMTREEGMTLRDYFAAKALSAYWNDPEVSESISTPENVAKWAYEMADAMLKARGE